MKTPEFIQGQRAARYLWKEGLSKGQIKDPIHPDFARGALTELEELQKGTPGVLKEALDGAVSSAEQIDVQAFHGILEVIQNADDLGASEVRLALHKRSGRPTLLILHDGNRVNIEHVIAMTLAFVSTKRDDPKTKGRFGIGLKTLGRLGRRLTVHCAPYDFVIEKNSVQRVSSANRIKSFFDPGSTNTLFELTLEPGFDCREFQSWFSGLGASALIFLDNVRSLRLFDIRRGRNITHHRLILESHKTVPFPDLSKTGQCIILKEPRSPRSWIRYEINWPVPTNLRRSHKAIGKTTPLGVAIPINTQKEGRLYAGLPLGVRIELPFSLNAQFDPDMARRGILHVELNKWLFHRLGNFISSLLCLLIESHPTLTWVAIPLKKEGLVGEDGWLSQKMEGLVNTVQTKAKTKVKFNIRGKARRIREIAYESESIDKLINQTEVDGLKPGLVLLPGIYRDPPGRWRKVLAELEQATKIDTREAIKLFDWLDEDLKHRDVRWFVKLAKAALEEGLGGVIRNQKSLVNDKGKRIIPPMPGRQGKFLVKTANPKSLASRLGITHTIHPQYLSRWAVAVKVRKWLEENSILQEEPDSESTLVALAQQETRSDPFVFKNEDLLAIRNLLESVPLNLSKNLGPKIGRAIAVNVRCWKGQERIRAIARPADSYLPASIEDRKDGWAKAAGNTQEINWIDPRYKKILQRKSTHRNQKNDGKSLGALGLFKLLGVENAPRLIKPKDYEYRYGEPASLINRKRLSEVQREKLKVLPRHATHLQYDFHSPDLLSVLKNLLKEKRLKEHGTRVRALVSTLGREWFRLYSTFLEAKAVYSDFTWKQAGTIPSSWIASMMDEPWLRNEAGKEISPRYSILHTRVTEVFNGDQKDLFLRELTEADATFPVIRALGIKTDPPVSELIEQLISIRDSGKKPTDTELELRYWAIAVNCKIRNPTPEDPVGDITVRTLRSRFGTKRNQKGLIYRNGSWFPPSLVFLGTPIFGYRKAFVSEKSSWVTLWHTLNLKVPSLTVCIDVLEDIAREQNPKLDEQVLLNTYQYLDQKIKDATAKELVKLRNLPLWIGTNWQKKRPVYLTLVNGVDDELSKFLPVWQPPLAANIIPNLVETSNVTVLTERSFTPVFRETSLCSEMELNNRFHAAVDLLQDWLVRHDPILAKSLTVPWETLSKPRIFCDDDLKIELNIQGTSKASFPTRAHISYEPLTFYFATPEDIGEDEIGGRILSFLFSEGDRDKLALAWSRCWTRTESGHTGLVKFVADETNNNSLEELFKQASADSDPRTTVEPRRTKPKHTGKEEPMLEPEVRRLKKIEYFSRRRIGPLTTDNKNTGKESRRRGLKDYPPKNKLSGSKRKPSSKSAPRNYSEKDKEDLAYEVLLLAINGEVSGLQDYRHLRGIGADALDKLHRYFEIKAHYGTMPDEITLTANEAERAFQQGANFYLAVISGLEEGFETIIKIISNPLRNLTLKPNTSVFLTGVLNPRAGFEVRLPTNEQKEVKQ